MADDDFIQPESDEKETYDEWITTFADIALLLLVFFILLFSMSNIDEIRFTDSFTSVRQALGAKESELTSTAVRRDDAAILETVRLQQQLIEAQRKVYSDVRTYLNRKGLEGVIGAVFDEGKITLRVPGDVLFESGRAELSPEGLAVMDTLREVFIQGKDQSINIRGYTDDVPPRSGSRFNDNWELSALRAVNVLRYFVREGIEPERMSATGLADLNPIFPNNSPENRAKNRRVEFVLEKEVGPRQ